MFGGPTSVWHRLVDVVEPEYEHATVYADVERETVLHEGPVVVRVSGWVELPSGRLFSPNAVHHIDVAPTEEG